MNKKVVSLASLVLISAMLLSACSGIAAFAQSGNPLNVAQAVQSSTSSSTQAASGTTSTSNPTTSNNAVSQAPAAIAGGSDLLAAYESTMESIYSTVNPQVVNIMVLVPASSNSIQNFPGFGNNNNNSQTPQYSQALGSGFFWDTNGNIVTNNHVVDGATKIEVTTADGTTVPATSVGQDPYSDLAVIKVSLPANEIHPVTMADSAQVKVGEIAVAIGNPYGFEGSMSVGNISGLGRDLPSSQVDQASGATYSIPDVIQTDASINPGNSGGVLVNIDGQVMGVTNAIESTSGSGSGVGFAIPAEIVSKVVPALISTGTYSHPYLGISGTDVTPDIAQAMNLPSDTRGALIEQVTPGGPAANANLQGSSTTVTINSVQGTVGGDIITAIDGQSVHGMSDIIAYLATHTQVSQTVTLSILRDGKTQNVEVTLGTRPS